MEHELVLTTSARDVLLTVIAREQAAIAQPFRFALPSEKFSIQYALAHDRTTAGKSVRARARRTTLCRPPCNDRLPPHFRVSDGQTLAGLFQQFICRSTQSFVCICAFLHSQHPSKFLQR